MDASLDGVSDANLVLEPGETVSVEPSWGRSPRCTAGAVAETGSATIFTGPAGGTYTILDDTANYGSFTHRGACSDTGDCYAMSVSAAANRPAQHWDASFTETLHPTTFSKRTWILHIGDSFRDLPRAHPDYRKVETLFHNGVAAGCTPTDYCPDQAISRADAAMFVARAYYGGDAGIPSIGDPSAPNFFSCTPGGVSLFEDVAPTDPFCKHVHALARWIDLTCAEARFCPRSPEDRGAMASLVAQAGPGQGGVPLVYGPDPGTGLSYSCDAASPDVHFSDVPVTDPRCRHAHFLWAKGIVGGCSATRFCLTDAVTKTSMADFLVDGFGLQLYDGQASHALPAECAPATALCLGQGRFSVEVNWKRPDGSSGAAHPIPISSESGYFWFFEPGNVEAVVKMLNGCSVNGHDWFFAAGLTNLEVALTVTNRTTGEIRTYTNPQGAIFEPILDTAPFVGCSAQGRVREDPGEPSQGFVAVSSAVSRQGSLQGCAESDTALCLGGRFLVEATWQAAPGQTGVGHAAVLTPESGYFWFFEPSNVELVAKALDACGIGQGKWFFAAGMTTVGVEIRVTDSLTGYTKTYSNPAGAAFLPIQDLAVFSECP